MKKIEPTAIDTNLIHLIGKEWGLLTAGQKDDYNMMTISWGSFGVLWNRPVCFVFSRPDRYTTAFLEREDVFSVHFFSEDYKSLLTNLGTKSGREIDKMNIKELHAIDKHNTILFKEAKLSLVCKKLYFQDLEPRHFLDEGIESNYTNSDYHRMYIGEIIAAYQSEEE